MNNSRLKVYGLSKSLNLASSIQSELDWALGTQLKQSQSDYNLLKFSDGEFQPQFNSCVRGDTVFLIQSTVPNSDSLMELLLAIDALKRASASHIVAVIPYFGWARQDRKDRPRIPIGAKAVATLIESVGCDRVISIDLHCDQIQGFFNIPVDHLYADSVLSGVVKKYAEGKDAVIVAPDMGAAKRAARFASLSGVKDVVFSYKHRSRANEIDQLEVVGDVKGKTAIICDDMIDTAGTLCKVAEKLNDLGANEIFAVATHGVFSGNAHYKIKMSHLSEVCVSDTINVSGTFPKLTTCSVANLLAEVILRVYEERSIVL